MCAGTYPEQVTIGKALTISASGTAVIQPTTAAVTATDPDLSNQPIVGIVVVQPGAGRVNISGLTVDGSAIQSSVDGCSDDLIGVFYLAGSAGNVSGTLKNLTVENTTPTNAGCGSGLGIDVEAGSSGTAQAAMHIIGNKVSGYGKNGITCSDVGTSCTIKSNTITTAPVSAPGQNGVQMSFGAVGPISNNTISGNYWTSAAGDSNPEVQSDYASGILLYGAGINANGATTTRITVSKNSLANNQSGIEVVDSDASLTRNSITETSPGIPDSIGIFGVGCDSYCGYFNADNGQTLTATAAANQAVRVTRNTINFSGSPSGSYGIWLGDNNWVGNSDYYPPAGHEDAHLSGNTISGATTSITIGGGAST